MPKRKKSDLDIEKELRIATYEFLKRNPRVREHFEKKVKELEGKIPKELLLHHLVEPTVIAWRIFELEGDTDLEALWRNDEKLEKIGSSIPEDTLRVFVYGLVKGVLHMSAYG